MLDMFEIYSVHVIITILLTHPLHWVATAGTLTARGVLKKMPRTICIFTIIIIIIILIFVIIITTVIIAVYFYIKMLPLSSAASFTCININIFLV
jgi:hypothetical protein